MENPLHNLNIKLCRVISEFLAQNPQHRNNKKISEIKKQILSRVKVDFKSTGEISDYFMAEFNAELNKLNVRN